MPLKNYFEGDPDFTAEQEAQLVRLTAALRGILDKSVKLTAPLVEIEALAQQAEMLNARMQDSTSVRPLAAHNKLFKPDDISWSSPYSPIAGRANPIAPPMQLRMVDDRVLGTVTYGDIYEGPPGCVHGGIIALTWDHVLALSNMVIESRGPTAYLHIDYRNPTPLNKPLQFEGWIEKVEGKKIYARGVCRDGDKVLTEANGLFIQSILRGLNIRPEDIQQKVIKGDQ